MITKDKIKEYRVEIDYLVNISKSISGIYTVDINKKREDESIDTFLKKVEKGEVSIDKHYNKVSPEVIKSMNSLKMAKSWLGKVLYELGDTNPYAKFDGKRKTVNDISETADKSSYPWMDYASYIFEKEGKVITYIEKVDQLREYIQNIIDETNPYKEYFRFFKKLNTTAMSYLFNCHRHLTEAKFWLGYELAKIKENN